jgi:hypothetical protein
MLNNTMKLPVNLEEISNIDEYALRDDNADQ